MDRVIVAYGSKYGATASIAEAIAATLIEQGFSVDVKPVGSVRTLDGYRAAVVGSAVYMARWRPDAVRFLTRQRAWLAAHDVWLFSSGPVGKDEEGADAAETERWTKPANVQALGLEIGAKDHAVFGGLIDDDRGMMRKMMSRNIPEDSRDRRDWDQIAAWATMIATALRSSA
jgi:menaquinone-dependent protoporphyrinogen oxidase